VDSNNAAAGGDLQNGEFGMGNAELKPAHERKTVVHCNVYENGRLVQSSHPLRICSYCQQVMGLAGPGFTHDTHGICPACYDAEVAKLNALASSIPHSEFRTPHSEAEFPTPHSEADA
jgi:hypothetical protein